MVVTQGNTNSAPLVQPSPPAPYAARGPYGTPSGIKQSPGMLARSPCLGATDLEDLPPGTVVTMDNVHTFSNHQILVRTTEAYRQALAPVQDPAASCVGIIVKVNADQCDKKGNGLRVDVLWDNGRPMQGYRVAFAKAFDLEAAETREADANPERSCHGPSPGASVETQASPRKSLWKRMSKLTFKSPFSSKSDCRHNRHSWPLSSPKSAPQDAANRSLDSSQCSVSVGYLNADAARRAAELGPQQDMHLWSPVGPVRYEGQSYFQQCGSVQAHHDPGSQTTSLHCEEVNVKDAKPVSPLILPAHAPGIEAVPPLNSMSVNPSNGPSESTSRDASPTALSSPATFATPPDLQMAREALSPGKRPSAQALSAQGQRRSFAVIPASNCS